MGVEVIIRFFINPNTIIIIGLGLDIIGACLIISRPAWKYLKSIFNQKAKSELDEEAIGMCYNRLGGDSNTMLKDKYVLGYLSDYKTAFWGFALLVLGFILQIIGNLI